MYRPAPVGRLELLAWVNDAMQTRYPRLEELADGVVYAQIFDAIYPGKLSLTKLNLSARFEEDYERNLTVLQEAFKKANVGKVVPIDKLKKGKLQDNQEFLQWLYLHLQHHQVDLKQHYPRAFEKRQLAVLRQQQQQGRGKTLTSGRDINAAAMLARPPTPRGVATTQAPATSSSPPPPPPPQRRGAAKGGLVQMKPELLPHPSCLLDANAAGLLPEDSSPHSSSALTTPRSPPTSTTTNSNPTPASVGGELPKVGTNPQLPELQGSTQSSPRQHSSINTTASEPDAPPRFEGEDTVRKIISLMEALLQRKLKRQVERSQGLAALKSEVDRYYHTLCDIQQLCLQEEEEEEEASSQQAQEILHRLDCMDPLL